MCIRDSIWEDHCLPEVIGPDGESLPYGEQGDLTFTTLTDVYKRQG